MKKNVVALISGLLFSIGLVLSGMTDPKKVIGFLDVFGSWDYSLVFTMVGAISVNLLSNKFIFKRKTPFFEHKFHLPEKINLDKNLMLGAVLFGSGWGLSGICPGPGLVSTTYLMTINSFVFVFMMIIGMKIYQLHQLRAERSK